MAASEIIQAKAVEKGNAALPHSRVQTAEPFALIIFGATGALTHTKLLPALFTHVPHPRNWVSGPTMLPRFRCFA